MPKYEWRCDSCDITWERECRIGKAPNRTKCPECGKLSDRYIGNMSFNISFKDEGNGRGGSMDFHTVRNRYKKRAEHGMDRDAAERFYRTSIKATKERLNDDTGRYKRFDIKYDKLAEDGKARVATDKEASQRRENAEKLTRQATEDANKRGYNLDITTGKPRKDTE